MLKEANSCITSNIQTFKKKLIIIINTVPQFLSSRAEVIQYQDGKIISEVRGIEYVLYSVKCHLHIHPYFLSQTLLSSLHKLLQSTKKLPSINMTEKNYSMNHQVKAKLPALIYSSQHISSTAAYHRQVLFLHLHLIYTFLHHHSPDFTIF